MGILILFWKEPWEHRCRFFREGGILFNVAPHATRQLMHQPAEGILESAGGQVESAAQNLRTAR